MVSCTAALNVHSVVKDASRFLTPLATMVVPSVYDRVAYNIAGCKLQLTHACMTKVHQQLAYHD